MVGIALLGKPEKLVNRHSVVGPPLLPPAGARPRDLPKPGIPLLFPGAAASAPPHHEAPTLWHHYRNRHRRRAAESFGRGSFVLSRLRPCRRRPSVGSAWPSGRALSHHSRSGRAPRRRAAGDT